VSLALLLQRLRRHFLFPWCYDGVTRHCLEGPRKLSTSWDNFPKGQGNVTVSWSFPVGGGHREPKLRRD
jgi:hypothetical protein